MYHQPMNIAPTPGTVAAAAAVAAATAAACLSHKKNYKKSRVETSILQKTYLQDQSYLPMGLTFE